MAALAGAMAGVLMAMIFIGHMSIVLVYNPPRFARNRDDEGVRLPVLMAILAGGSFLAWAGLGVAAALFFSAAEQRYPSNVPGVPSVLYAAAVMALLAASAPLPVLLARGIRRHVVVEYVVCAVIFAWLIPMIARAR